MPRQGRRFAVVIVSAGMVGVLFSVLGGLVGGVLIAVPTSTGHAAARGGETALRSTLVSCAPGVVAVNVDNGYGGACAALRVLHEINDATETPGKEGATASSARRPRADRERTP